jgi:hypothetical protein
MERGRRLETWRFRKREKMEEHKERDMKTENVQETKRIFLCFY